RSGHRVMGSMMLTGPLTGVLSRMSRQSMWLKCVECGIIKNGIDEMEVHMKTEHVNWLPFKCPLCGCRRALNSQMTEHLHSSHRSKHTSFVFEDDSEASFRLRELMDETIRSSLIPPSEEKKDEANEEFISSSGEKVGITSQIGIPPTATPSSADDSVLSKKRVCPTESSDISPSGSHSEESGAMAAILASASMEETVEGSVRKKVKVEEEDEEKGEEKDEMTLDPSLAAYLSGLGALFNGIDANEAEIEGVEHVKEVKVKRTRSSTVRYCTKCNKGVKSNEKGAHVSFHLSKDFQMNRFQCKIGSCTHESYRKVNIVNHQLKVHSLDVADHSLINDRQQEMAHLYQMQLVELFGSNETEDVVGDTTSHSVNEEL
ncbi:hypothetical protein PMAYCL1PPCAC_29295, partial [Pristionchus mayeri]